MSTLTEKISEALDAHIFDKPIGRCRCDAEMSATGHRTREHRAHLSEVITAVVAEWLLSDEAAPEHVRTLMETDVLAIIAGQLEKESE